ncbi:MAG: L-seryl-tRNA(Sec) selenium transferase, partial [Dehalococcoidia bacterium]
KAEAIEKIPIWRMIASPMSEIENRAAQWANQIGEPATTVAGESMVGGGSLPGSTLPTRLVVIKMPGNIKAQNLAQRLRLAPMPVVCRIEHNTLIVDPRSVLPEQDADLLRAVSKLLR